MAKQTFTTGQVLTAAQMTSLQQTAMLGGAASAKVASYVLVAADAGTAISMSNGSATTITVNTGLFAAGDIVTILNLGAGVCTITAGTATVATSGSLALAQNQGGVLRFTSASAAIFFQFATPASGDIEGVTAGTGLSGGGTSGTVTITNSMATEITASGDIIVGTGSGTFDNLPIGSTGQVLTADTTVSPYKVKWATPASGDIEGVTAGTGISGGGTSGTVTITNSMATAIDAKGDLVAGTGADTFARLAVGTNGQVLTANSANATGLGWSTIATGSLTQIASVTFNNTSGTWDVTSIPSTYTHLMVIGLGLQTAQSSAFNVSLRLNNDSGSNYNTLGWRLVAGAAGLENNIGGTSISFAPATGLTGDSSSRFGSFICMIPNYASANYKTTQSSSGSVPGGSGYNAFHTGFWNSTAAIDRITIIQGGPSAVFKAGNAILYGVN